jgi:hypothetical protein
MLSYCSDTSDSPVHDVTPNQKRHTKIKVSTMFTRTMQSKLVLIAALVVAITAAITSAVPIGLSQLPEHDVGVDAIPAEAVEDVDADFFQMSENELEATAFPSDAAEAVGTDFTQVSEKESTSVAPSHISTVDFGKTVLASLQANMQKLSASMDALKAASDKAAVDAAASKSIFDSSVTDAASKKASMESSMQSSVTASQRCSESQNAVIAADEAKTQAINTAKDVSAIDRELALIAQVKEKLVEVLDCPSFIAFIRPDMVIFTHKCAVDERQGSATNGKSANIRRPENQFHAGCS